VKPVISLDIDFTSFKYATIELIVSIKAKSGQALLDAMKALREDCWNIPPKCPYLTGALHDSHHILPLEMTADGYVATMRVEQRYAATQHEGFRRSGAGRIYYRRYTLPGSGPKWIEAKILAYATKYIGIFAEGISP
jgi:hypothetical protein